MAAVRASAAAVALLALSCAHFSDAFAESLNNVGFREMRGENGGAFGVWYPTEETPRQIRLGPFDAEYAKDAAPDGKMLPLVVMSHGNSGYYRNHHLTAAHLAENGFVVIAPQHIHFDDLKTHIHGRVNDIKRARAALQNDEGFAPILDADNISAVGYSLGGASVLAAAGVSVNWESFLLHCARNHGKDENACNDFSFWLRWMLWAKHAFLPNPKIQFWDFSQNPVAFRKIALVAPVGQMMDAESLAKLSAEVLILQIDGDTILRAPFHSEHLRDNLPPRTTEYELIRGGYHYGFVPRFSQRIPDEDLPAELIDPPGFDREKFIAEINEKILAFLRK